MTHEPLMEIAVEPKTPKDAEAFYEALLEMMSREQPIRGRPDHESGQFLLCGDSEPELDAVLEELINGRKIAINVGAPQVAYLETLGRAAEIDHTYKRQAGSVGEFARVRLRFEPSHAYAFESRLDAALLPAEFVEGVERGLEAARAEGLVAGFRVVDFKATLLDGAFHDIDSSPATFDIAARQAFKQLRREGEPRLIWPVMELFVASPLESVAAVQEGLMRKGGRVTSIHREEEAAEIAADVPLANLFGYGDTLRELTGGRGHCTMRFAYYAPVSGWPGPDDVFPGAMGMRA